MQKAVQIKLPVQRFPRVGLVERSTRKNFHTHMHPVTFVLNCLPFANLTCVIKRILKYAGNQLPVRPALLHPENVCRSAVDPLDTGQSAAAITLAGGNSHNVPNFVPNERLKGIRKVRYEDFLAGRTRWHGPVVLINNF